MFKQLSIEGNFNFYFGVWGVGISSVFKKIIACYCTIEPSRKSIRRQPGH